MKQIKADRLNKVRFTLQDTDVSKIKVIGFRPVGAGSFVILPFDIITLDCYTFLIEFQLDNGIVNDGTHEMSLLGVNDIVIRSATVQVSGNTGIETYIKRT
jgi:hypothetical protein